MKKLVAAFSVTLLAFLLAVLPSVSWGRPRQCGTFEFWTDSNGCDHEKYRYTDCETGEWIGTVEIIYC